MSPVRTIRHRAALAAASAAAVVITGSVAAFTATAPASAAACNQVLFDDFNYTSSSDSAINSRGWSVRTNTGGPGVPGAAWPASNISFPSITGGKALQLRAATDGTSGGTSQAEFLSSSRRFFEGTYGARVKFADAPDSGTDGDHLVETFFTITPLNFDLDPNYGEIDFEYLPNGGWGEQGPIFYQTTWETYRNEPWLAENTHTEERASYNGWHDLAFQVSGGHVKYFIDGVQVADHSGIYYPETPMSLNFNLWFIDTAAHTSGTSVYTQQVDYFYHTVGEAIAPSELSSRVSALRSSAVGFTDTMGTGGGTCPTGSPSASSTSKPPSPSVSPSTSVSPSPSRSPSTSPSPSGPVGGCGTLRAWDWGTVYLEGELVKHAGHKWRARWWTLGSEPGLTAQWEDKGLC
ncbi:hypothetical protein F4553_002506 [Allocatelliglobosispora scoriae]|uniref:GH16 domain-containing protein n=1 Tax=Allocatelliglobosispora scoriae TaxID=643052 RepID=A0A841BJ37_9ACTN|nr:family 16 glycosylhydrolase [Allocatelliglobosispora scoriae]MBB5869127.1 hypothetical protein [Allocatelliglobosispora scoriae]